MKHSEVTSDVAADRSNDLSALYDLLENLVHKLVIQYGRTTRAIADNVDIPSEWAE
jgi:hypothetical protein